MLLFLRLNFRNCWCKQQRFSFFSSFLLLYFRSIPFQKIDQSKSNYFQLRVSFSYNCCDGTLRRGHDGSGGALRQRRFLSAFLCLVLSSVRSLCYHPLRRGQRETFRSCNTSLNNSCRFSYLYATCTLSTLLLLC